MISIKPRRELASDVFVAVFPGEGDRHLSFVSKPRKHSLALRAASIPGQLFRRLGKVADIPSSDAARRAFKSVRRRMPRFIVARSVEPVKQHRRLLDVDRQYLIKQRPVAKDILLKVPNIDRVSHHSLPVFVVSKQLGRIRCKFANKYADLIKAEFTITRKRSRTPAAPLSSADIDRSTIGSAALLERLRSELLRQSRRRCRRHQPQSRRRPRLSR